MKRSTRVPLRLVPIAAAAFLAGCSNAPQRTCVDRDGRVVPDANCVGQSWDDSAPQWRTQYPYSNYYWHSYRPYGRFFSRSFFSSGRSFAGASHATARGGFGSTAAGHASGGS